MEDEGARRFDLVDAVDRNAAVVAPRRIVGPGEYHRDRRVVSFPQRLEGATARRRGQPLEEVTLETRQEGLRLRIAEARIELEHPRAVIGQHQAREEAADEGRPSIGELVDDGLVDLGDELVARVEPCHRRVRAHPAGVRAEVAVAGALEVLGGAERHGSCAVADREQRDFASLEQLLDHDCPAERTHLGERLIDRVDVVADEDSLPGGEAVGLHHTRRACGRQRRRRRDPGSLEYLLREALRALDAGSQRAGAEDGDSCVAQFVRDAGHERSLRSDHDEIRRQRDGEVEEAVAIVGANRVAGAEARDAGVAGRRVQLGQARALRQPPSQRMLTRTRADEEHSHLAESTAGFGNPSRAARPTRAGARAR